MPAQRLPWIKFWPEAVEHEKFAALTDAESWSWVVVWSKASLQPTRWRFASVQHAHHVTGRPVKHLRKLIEVRLLDDGPEGLLIHDARHWQDASNLPPTQREQWSNGDRTVIHEPPKGDLEGEGEGEIEREEDENYSVGGAAVNGAPRPIRKNGRANGTNPRAIGTNPRAQVKVAAVIDAFRALKIEPVLSGRDFKAIKDTTASPGLIAEVYDAVARREYGDAFMQKRLSVHEAIEWVNGYSEWKWEGQHGKDFEEPATYDTLAPCGECGKSCTAKWLEEHNQRCSDCWRARPWNPRTDSLIEGLNV